MSNKNVTLNKKLKEVLKNSFIYGLTSSLQTVLGFIILPILTVYYTPEIFGVYSILLLLSALTGAIFYFGASSSLGRFYFEDDSEFYKKKIITTSIIVTLVGGFLLIFLGLIFSDKLSFELFHTNKYSKSILLILIGTATSFLTNLMTILLRYEKKAIHFFIVTLVGLIINFTVTYILLAKLEYGLLAPIYGVIISNILCISFLLIFRFKLLTLKLERKHFILILKFGIQSSVAGLFFYILEWVDRLILKDLLNLNQVGVYSLGYRLGSLMNILLVMPFSLVWGPMRMQYAKNKDTDFFTGKIISYYTAIGVLILVFTILFGEEILKLIFENMNYANAMPIVPIIMCSIFIYGYQNIVDFGIYIHEKVYIYILTSLFAIFINVIMNYSLIPFYGYTAAAYVTLFTYIITSSFIYFISNSYYKIKVETIRVASALTIVPILYCINNYLLINSMVIKFSMGILIFFLFYKCWLNNKERDYVINIFRKHH